MKKMLLILMLIISSLVASAEEYWCPKCQAEVLADDVFCPSCRYRLKEPLSSVSAPTQEQTFAPQYQYGYTSSSSQGGLPFYQGMGRGLVTVCGSPLECIRFVGISFVEVVDWDKRTSGNSSFNAGDLGPIGAALAGGLVVGTAAVGVAGGCVSAVGDVCVGTLDFVTFGVVGDAVWEGQKKSPYFWSRRWGRGDVGGAIF